MGHRHSSRQRLSAHGDQLGLTPEQRHDDCQWLDEVDGKENVL
jgi:hypothetical protein